MFAFVAPLATLGYATCESGDLGAKFEAVEPAAIAALPGLLPTASLPTKHLPPTVARL